jgi:beta-phosphoglucomutase-like phosphatase (HAD superfamily)
MGWQPADCAVVEDSPAGVEAGLSAGMTVFGYAGATPPSWLTQPTSSAGTGDALRVFTDMAELPGLLQPPS